MKLKEKFNDLVPVEFGGMQEPLLTECEKIADEHAIAFGEWLTNSSIKNTDLPMSIKLKMYKDKYGL